MKTTDLKIKKIIAKIVIFFMLAYIISLPIDLVIIFLDYKSFLDINNIHTYRNYFLILSVLFLFFKEWKKFYILTMIAFIFSIRGAVMSLLIMIFGIV